MKIIKSLFKKELEITPKELTELEANFPVLLDSILDDFVKTNK